MSAAENAIAVKTREPSKVSKAIGSFFHVYERGSTIRSEIGAGIGSFLIAVAAFLMNTQIIGEAYGSYAGSYLAVALVSFIGTLLLGILFNRPIVQCCNLSLSTALVSMITANAGLTYANMMAITFFSALLSLAVVISPLGKKLTTILPLSIRKALPIGVCLFTMIQALSHAGFISDNVISNVGSMDLRGFYFLLMVLASIAFVCMKIFHVRKATFRLFGTLLGLMWAGGILFYMASFIGGSTATIVVYERLNLIIATDGALPYNISLGFSSVDWGMCFTKGFDFSALIENGGNPALVFIQGVIVFLVLSLYTNVSNLNAVAEAGDYLTDEIIVDNERRVFLITSAINVVAPILGAPISTVSASSAVSSDNEAKTGLSSVIAAIGFFVCLFTWAVFALTATQTHGVGMWISESEVKLQAYAQDVFAFADLMVALAALNMLRGFRKVDVHNIDELIPFAATLVGMVILGDFALGIGLGLIFDAVIRLARRQWTSFNTTTVAAPAVSLLYLVLAVI